MRQDINQNIDLPQENSLHEEVKPIKQKLFRNPRIILLVSLSALILILLITALLISKNRTKSSPDKTLILPEKTINTPTPASQFSQKIDQIEQNINSGNLLEPPLIDEKIGL